MRDAAGQFRIHLGQRLGGFGSFQRAGMHAATPQVGDGHPIRREPGDRRRHEHADRLHAGRLEFHVGLRADVNARRPRRPCGQRAVERASILHVVEHRGPLDPGHRTDHVRQFFLDGDSQEFLLSRPALPRAVPLQRPSQAAAKLAGQRLCVYQRPHVGALPRPRHPHPAVLRAVARQLRPIEGRLHDRQLRRREHRAGEQFDLLARGPVAEQPCSPADRGGDQPQRDHLRGGYPGGSAVRIGRSVVVHDAVPDSFSEVGSVGFRRRCGGLGGEPGAG